jgi:hypothetical protein
MICRLTTLWIADSLCGVILVYMDVSLRCCSARLMYDVLSKRQRCGVLSEVVMTRLAALIKVRNFCRGCFECIRSFLRSRGISILRFVTL